MLWAERAGRDRAGGPASGGPRFVFYGRVSTEDWQDPVTSRARQREQAGALVAQLADPGRGWGAIVVGEYERAFYGSQYAAMAPLFEHYGVQLWMAEAGGRVDYASEHEAVVGWRAQSGAFCSGKW